jgi:ParB family transcriptional regulator, chromosome partitioning protein
MLDTLAVPAAVMPKRVLVEPQELAESGPAEAVRLPLDLIDPSLRNPRKDLPEVEALAESIKDPDFGLLQPIVVRRLGGRYEIVNGHRRWSAYLLLKEQEPHNPHWRTIPAVVRTMDDQTAHLAMIVSQVQFRAWKPKEEAAVIEEMLTGGMNQKQVGERLHRTEAWVSKRSRMYSDAVLSAYVQTGKLPRSVAEEMLLVGDPSARREMAETAASEGWSQAQTRNQVRKLKREKELRLIQKRALELLESLAIVDRERLPEDAQITLVKLRLRIGQLAGLPDDTGKPRGPVFPPLEATGINQTSSSRRSRKPKPKRRVMPLPAPPD